MLPSNTRQELRRNPMDAEKGWSATLQPLADDIVAKYKVRQQVISYVL